MKDVKLGQIVQIKNKAETGLDKTKLYFVKDKFISDDRTIITPVEDKANVVVDTHYGGFMPQMEHCHIISCRDLKLVSEQSHNITTWGFAIDIAVNSTVVTLTDEDFSITPYNDVSFFILKSLFSIEGFNYFVILDKKTGDFKHIKLEVSIDNLKFVQDCLVHLLYNKPSEKEYEVFVKDLKAKHFGITEVNFLNKTVPISIISNDSTFIAYSPEEDCTYSLRLDYWTRALSISRSYKEYNVYVEDFYYDICQGNECLPEYKFDNNLSDKENINNNNIMIAKFIEDKKLYLVNVSF